MHGRVEAGDDDRSERDERLVVLQAIVVAAGEDRLREPTRANGREAVAERPLEEAGELRRGGFGRIGRAEPERRVGPPGGRVGQVEAEPLAHHPQRNAAGERGHHVAAAGRDEVVDELGGDRVDDAGHLGDRARRAPLLHRRAGRACGRADRSR